ncbi:MAG: ABC transporter substrate-binding protein [Anaerolineae bacterium]|nr:ABC transporter substrate-binding protein [Anaerolineae bacterium]
MRPRCVGLLSVLVVLGLLVAACGPTPAPQVVEKEVTRVVSETIVETVIVEGTPQVVERVVEKVITTTPEPTAGPAAGGTLVYMLASEPDSLDPHKTVRQTSWEVMRLLHSSLVTQDPEGNYVPYLAESWEMSEDGLTWTFHLKEGLTFHDGTPVTAQDVAWSYMRAKDPANPGAAGASLAAVESVEATDDSTVVMHLPQPFFPLLTSLSDPGYFGILSQQAVEAAGEDYGRQPLGTGPYRFKEWVTGEKVVVERNPDFAWGPPYAHQGPWYPDEIEFRIIPESATQVVSMEAGEIDVGAVDASDEETIRQTGLFTLYDVLMPGTGPYLQFNNSKPPLDDARVRQALSMAIDRDVLVKVVMNGKAVAQHGPLSPSTIGYWEGVEYVGYSYNLDRARALLAEAGYTANASGMLEKDGQPLQFTLKTIAGEETWLRIAEIIQEQFRALGVDVQLEQQEAGALVADEISGNYEMGMMQVGWQDADILYQMFHSSMIGALNLSHINDPELDEILTKTRTTLDPAARQQWVDDAQRYITERAFIAPLLSPLSYLAVSNRVEGEQYSLKTFFNYLDDAYLVR